MICKQNVRCNQTRQRICIVTIYSINILYHNGFYKEMQGYADLSLWLLYGGYNMFVYIMQQSVLNTLYMRPIS